MGFAVAGVGCLAVELEGFGLVPLKTAESLLEVEAEVVHGLARPEGRGLLEPRAGLGKVLPAKASVVVEDAEQGR